MTLVMILMNGPFAGDQAMAHTVMSGIGGKPRFGPNVLWMSVMLKMVPYVSSAEKGTYVEL